MDILCPSSPGLWAWNVQAGAGCGALCAIPVGVPPLGFVRAAITPNDNGYFGAACA